MLMADVERIVSNARFRVVLRDWDFEYQFDILNKLGFRITEKGKTDMNDQAGMYSIHSPLYGSDLSDGRVPEERWTCKCGETIGNSYNGTICPKCGTKVEFIEPDMRTTGWIVLDRDYIIQPELFKKIQSIIGTKNLNNIIKYKDPRERDANIPFDGIGLIEFRERFEEIMHYFVRKRPTKEDQYIFVMANQSYVFAKSIPVYSSYLRPFVVRSEEIRYSDEDKLFRRIFSNSLLLNNRYKLDRRVELFDKRVSEGNPTRGKKTINDLRREGILYAIQADINSLWDASFETTKKKTGQVRDKILGGRLVIWSSLNLSNCGDVL